MAAPVQPTSSRSSRQTRAPAVAQGRSDGPSQRERLIDAIVELAGQRGYQDLTIAQISAQAGVSSATFYEQFAEPGRRACSRPIARSPRARLRRWARYPRANGAARCVPRSRELLRSVQQDPDAGRVMFVEALAGGPRVRAAVRELLDAMERNAEPLLGQTPPDGATLDIPARALIGGARHVVAHRLRTHDEDRLPQLAEDLLASMACYAVPVAAGRWSIGPQALLPAQPPRRPGRPRRGSSHGSRGGATACRPARCCATSAHGSSRQPPR